MNEISVWLTTYLVPIATALGAFVAYLTFYSKSKPHIAVYYQASQRQQTIIELVIENIGSGTAFNVNFSQPLPVNCFGIGNTSPNDVGDSVPILGIPCLVPGQRLIFRGGQYGGLLAQIGEGFELQIEFKFHPPLWCEALGTNMSRIGIKHLSSTATVKSLDQAVVDAITGLNKTTIRDIRDALQSIDLSLAATVRQDSKASERDSRLRQQLKDLGKTE